VVAVASPILRHRLILNFAAQSEGVTVEDVIKQLVKTAARKFENQKESPVRV
jgi:MoxR-like ATPase